MKKFILFCLPLIALIFSACGGSVKIDENLSPEETQAVRKTESALPAGTKLQNYEVVKAKLPLALLADEYKSFRDDAYKARLDYRTNVTRNLPQIAEKNLQTLKTIQSEIINKDSSLNAQSPEYIFVLADVKERERRDGNLTAFIAVFDPENVEQVDFVQVTKPLYNNAVMVTEALDGTLANPDPADEANLKSENPVVNFILKGSPK